MPVDSKDFPAGNTQPTQLLPAVASPEGSKTSQATSFQSPGSGDEQQSSGASSDSGQAAYSNATSGVSPEVKGPSGGLPEGMPPRGSLSDGVIQVWQIAVGGKATP